MGILYTLTSCENFVEFARRFIEIVEEGALHLSSESISISCKLDGRLCTILVRMPRENNTVSSRYGIDIEYDASNNETHVRFWIHLQEAFTFPTSNQAYPASRHTYFFLDER